MTQLTIAPPAGLNDDALYKSTFYLLTYLLTYLMSRVHECPK